MGNDRAEEEDASAGMLKPGKASLNLLFEGASEAPLPGASEMGAAPKVMATFFFFPFLRPFDDIPTPKLIFAPLPPLSCCSAGCFRRLSPGLLSLCDRDGGNPDGGKLGGGPDGRLWLRLRLWLRSSLPS